MQPPENRAMCMACSLDCWGPVLLSIRHHSLGAHPTAMRGWAIQGKAAVALDVPWLGLGSGSNRMSVHVVILIILPGLRGQPCTFGG